MKKIENGKLRFNIIDILIIIIVIGSIVGVVFRYDIVDRLVLDSKRDEVRVSFMITGLSPQISEQITDGDEFYVVGSSDSIGTLVEHRTSNYLTVEANEKGEPVQSFDNTLRDVRGTFQSYGVLNEDGFFLEGTLFIAPGKTLTIESRNVRVSVIITEITQAS